MKNKEWNLPAFRPGTTRKKEGGWTTRSVLARGSPLPLFIRQSMDSHSFQSTKELAWSKTWRFAVALFCFWLLLSVFSLRASGQSYSIDWHKIAGGGGTSTGGVYSVSGTIGQPDAGPTMTNGQYSLTGGFWVLPQAVQTEGAPTLIIAPAGSGQAIISWTPGTGTNWILQETVSLSPTNWMNSSSGWTNPIVVPATTPTKFYRLSKP
jgi:hypothetical protein